MNYEDYFKKEIYEIDQALDSILPPAGQRPSEIHEAMRYAVFPSGKRFRPVLTLAASEACGGESSEAIWPAVSIELIHTYSLVHDDLPSMDNDDERRGRPTCHKKFGEALALLAGDGLLTLAFQVLARSEPRKMASFLEEISTASGTYGMIGGQVAELVAQGSELSLPLLDYIHSHKTGKLITVSVVCGALAAGADLETLDHIRRYGENLGLAFQLVDDLQDQDGYLKLTGAQDVVEKIRDVMARAKQEIRGLGPASEKLMQMADYLLKRIPREHHAMD